MKILVTGGCGFIGSHIVEALLNENHEVSIIDNLSSGELDNIDINKVSFFNMDICNSEVSNLICDIKPEVIIHLAAQVNVSFSIRNPIQDSNVNINGLLNILKGASISQTRKIIFASSAAVYGDPKEGIINTSQTTMPKSPYGITKLASEHYLLAARELYGIETTILRFANVFGPRQVAHGDGGVIAIFCDKLKNNMNLTVYGDGNQTRDFVYVKDLACAAVKALTLGDNQIFHISTGKSTSINQVIDIISEISNHTPQVIYEEKRPGDIRDSCLDPSKTELILEWKSKFTFREGIIDTLKYSKNYTPSISQ